ncbi:MAG: hypothetical protein JO091_14755 [Acidobacteriaceae bacterium]|nr:hypothetical protein [Acidobacteriaceae bacterium]
MARLEIMETHIAATKIALRELQHANQNKSSGKGRTWRSWFGLPALSFAGAAALAALCIAAFLPAQVNLSAYRGSETVLVPEWRPLDVHLKANDLADGPLALQVVDQNGTEIWKGTTLVRNEAAEAHIGRITRPGSYLLRLYEPAAASGQGNLLREFAFQAK